jgi:hypothetical protein
MQAHELPAPLTKPTRVYYIVEGALSLVGDQANFKVCISLVCASSIDR